MYATPGEVARMEFDQSANGYDASYSLVFQRMLTPGGLVYQCTDGDVEHRMWFENGKWDINTYHWARDVEDEDRDEAIRNLVHGFEGVPHDAKVTVEELDELPDQEQVTW